ncbi:MAG: DEAD/DEAH box helicase [Acidimicrobiales bacterium]
MLADEIAAALSAAGGATAAELAQVIGAAERDVESALFAGHHRFRHEKGEAGRWWLAGRAPGGGQVRDPATAASPAAETLLLASLSLYPWQSDALRAWERHGGRGVVEAVTGAGKTMVGVAAALAELARRGQVVVLVPTVDLQHQWVAVLEARLAGVAGGDGWRVGRMGAGAGDRLATHDVLVAVVNSARSLDVRPIRRGGLLVGDECHRYGSAANHLALDERFRRRLGLSATYAREDDGNLAWLDPYFGGTCFRLGYARAVAEEVTARFTVTLVGVRFSPGEQGLYDDLTERMRALRARLLREAEVPAEPFDAFLRAVLALADSADEGGAAARAYRQAMLERRRLLADTPAKQDALAMVAPSAAEAERTIVFTQSISASELACRAFCRFGLPAGVVHSGLAGQERQAALRRFAEGELTVLSAPRVLDEGIDVPAADLGVIVGASRSRRQMVQRMGRVLRRKPDGRLARFAVLFVEGTVEDPSHGAHEAFLDEIVGVADRVSYLPAAVTGEQPGLVGESLRG